MLSPLKAMNAKQKKIEEKKQQQLEEQEEQDIMEEESTNDGQIQENESVKDEKEQPKQQRNIRFIAKIIEPQLVLLTIHDVNKTADSLVVEVSICGINSQYMTVHDLCLCMIGIMVLSCLSTV